MHRRSFVAALAATLAAIPLATRAKDPITWARRNFEPEDPKNSTIVGIHPLVNVFPDVLSASTQMHDLQTLGHPAPTQATPATYDPIEILPAPDGIDLPAVMRRWESSAFNESVTYDAVPHISISVQRDACIVDLMVRGHDETEVTALITSLMHTMVAYDMPSMEPVQDETGRHTGGIWDLLLHEADVPDGFRLYQEADETGVVNFHE